MDLSIVVSFAVHTTLSLFTPHYSPRKPIERALIYPAIGTFLGCWVGVIPIALDWDRPWQVRPGF